MDSAAVVIDGVEKNFGRLRALSGVSLEIAGGEFFGLLGPNGAGKTTLISCLAGLARPDRGRISVLGHDTVTDYRAARRLLGVVPQELVFDPFFTVRETLRIQSGYFGIRGNDDWIDEILDHLDLNEKADTNTRRLSGGMKRRLLVAQALVHRPPVIVLDEPTAGVDVELRQGLWKFIQRLNREGHTIILTTHYLEEAEALCGRIAMLKAGEVVALDTTQNLLKRFSGHALSLRLRLEGNAMLPPPFSGHVTTDHDGWSNLPLPDPAAVTETLSTLERAGVRIADVRLSAPDLEEVFVHVMNEEKER
ncbi:MAG: ABC transporter ATP-binding protein [Betaproteobacteria bacterium]|nr:ABC transporter ATP-binding protein [Betaproteobacteria bacterium]